MNLTFTEESMLDQLSLHQQFRQQKAHRSCQVDQRGQRTPMFPQGPQPSAVLLLPQVLIDHHVRLLNPDLLSIICIIPDLHQGQDDEEGHQDDGHADEGHVRIEFKVRLALRWPRQGHVPGETLDAGGYDVDLECQREQAVPD